MSVYESVNCLSKLSKLIEKESIELILKLELNPELTKII